MDGTKEPNNPPPGIPNDVSSTGSRPSILSALDTSLTLRQQLNGGIAMTFNQERFIPLDNIQRILNPKAVELELRTHSSNLSEEIIDSAIKSVCYWAEANMCLFGGDVVKPSSRLRVFATLVLIEATDRIADFIREGIHDAHLPIKEAITPNSSQSSGPLSAFYSGIDISDIERDTDDLESNSTRTNLDSRVSVAWKTPNCDPPGVKERWESEPKRSHFPESFNSWPADLRNLFCQFQWLSLSPFFCSSSKVQMEQKYIPFYNIPNDVALPFKSCDNLFSDHQYVSQLEIYPGHHDFPRSPGQRQDVFVLERLKLSRSLEAFNVELYIWRKALAQGDLHIQKLHAAFKYRGKVYLIQPKAKGNLVNLWESESQHPLSRNQLAWVAKQCHGIAGSIEMIHKIQRERANISSGYGQLQPKDILWLEEGREGEIGTLKIARLVVRKIHRPSSTMYPRFRAEYSTYLPPESRIERQTCPESDMWTLGCIFLEFAIWCLSGWEGYEEFSQMRAEEKNMCYRYRCDQFFKEAQDESDYDIRQSPDNVRFFVLKKSVTEWIFRLKQSSCPPFLQDFLDFIQTDMLVIDPAKRASSSRVYSFLGTLNDRCQADPNYCKYVNKDKDFLHRFNSVGTNAPPQPPPHSTYHNDLRYTT